LNFKIPENLRHSVIRLWTEGKSRKHIAITCGLGEGTVSNIVAEWYGSDDDDDNNNFL
jgi:transposase